LISDKQLDAKNYNTSIIFDGILSYDAIDTIDLCVTFGNALDNAIEACMKLPVSDQKTVSVCVTQNKNLLLVKISNPVAENVTVKNNSVQTTKNDRAAHGIGLYSISSTVKKYNGFCELKCENNVFTIEMGFFINRSQP
ncbi:MAG: ATP-binding protein, partial [Clostridia bacterium]|nr:ATP-binding protein [Clostridia bacterium]